MRRIFLIAALGLALAFCALPQEASSTESKGATQTSEPSMGWEWANFVILAAVLGYLINKSVPPLFRRQSEEIQAALAEAQKIKHEAAAYAAGVEMRLANLQREIEELRATARAEMSAEGERIRRETEHHLQRIQEQSTQEVALMTRGAKDELRKYAAGLALDLAQERVRSRMNAEIEENLVRSFLSDLSSRADSRTAAN